MGCQYARRLGARAGCRLRSAAMARCQFVPFAIIVPAFAGACVTLDLHRLGHRRLARYCQWLFVPHLPACWGVHSKFPRLASPGERGRCMIGITSSKGASK
eukprot:scaffold60412_cov83-Phaeocystis_antarctica.AAC.1